MLEIGSNDPDLLNMTLSNEDPLTVLQKAAIKTEITTDPAGLGYNGKNIRVKFRLFAQKYTIPNPNPPTQVLIRPISAEGEVMIDKGTASRAELEAEIGFMTDPSYQANLQQTPRREVVLGVGRTTTLAQFQEALA